MNSFVMFTVLALATVANCEAPGYNYNRPSFGGGVSAGGNSFGNGFGSSGGGAFSSGGNYEQVAIGGNSNEGLNVDPQLLEKIKQILLNEESKAGAGGIGGGFGGQPSSQYGAPQPQYGPPPQAAARVVGIYLENTQPAIQVAQYRAQSTEAGGYAASTGGVAPSSSYGVPSAGGYSAPAPARPSSSYGAPF